MNTKTVDSRPSITLCTLGQEGHGKTALTAAILQVLAKTGGATRYTYEDLLPPPAFMTHACDGAELAHVEYTTQSRRYLHADPARHNSMLVIRVATHTPIALRTIYQSMRVDYSPMERPHN